MRVGHHICAAVAALLWAGAAPAPGQETSLHGQASAWVTTNPELAPVSQTGIRYIPEVTVRGKLSASLEAEADLSLNTFAAATFEHDQRPDLAGTVKPYRAWLRLASGEFEVRAGLQRISFGSATLFRPLMWFDKIDPRDPLQLTDGVYGLLARYYFRNNANLWLWTLYGNDEPKGWEVIPTAKRTVELGGRAQTPMLTGEMGISYHHRQVDLGSLVPETSSSAGTAPEDRLALDGKWDLGIGAWFEAALIHTQTDYPGLSYQRQWTVGMDYTFDVGNSLTALAEHFRIDFPGTPLGPASGREFSGLSLVYPLGLLDRISAILYRDWTDHDWYRLVSWQRTYDAWSFYLLGFWNPRQIQLYRTQAGNNPLAGTGIQFMVVFNH